MGFDVTKACNLVPVYSKCDSGMFVCVSVLQAMKY